jgi:5S rRNA maturation endonuclease (ribonuclease M5)
MLDAVASCLGDVLKEQYTEKKRAERGSRSYSRPERIRSYEWSLKEAVFKVMKQAAEKASANFTLPFSVRQLYYQVRPLIQEYTNKELNYAYFTPPLVTEYEDDYGKLPGLVYEARGHLIEPHQDVEVPLGTLEVAGYEIPDWEYDKILYIEKEGFRQIFNAVKLGQRYDMAFMTAKGFATRAAKELLSRASDKEVTILVAHDADISGYEIARTLESATRTCPDIDIDVIDIGLTVKEALDMGLESEKVAIQKRPSYELLGKLSPDEKQFLLGEHRYHYGGGGGYLGKRVELNAMATDQLISWLEGKLKELGLQTKVLPPEDTVEEELEDSIDSKLDEDIKKLVKEAIEKLLGATIADIEEAVKEEIDTPECSGYYAELKDFLKDCTPEYWRDWIAKKASEIEQAYIKDKEPLVSDLLSERLERRPTE